MSNPLYRFLANAVAWFAANLMSRLVAAILFFILTHTSTLTDSGAYSLANTFLALSIPLMGWGFEHLLIRDVARNRQQSPQIVGEFLARRILLAICTYSLLILAVSVIGYPFPTKLIILIACFSLATDGLAELLQAYLVGTEQTPIGLWAAIPANLLRLGAGIWVLVHGYGAFGLMLVLTGTSFFRCGLLFWVIAKNDTLLQSINLRSLFSFLQPRTWQSQLVSAAPFVLIDIAWIVELQIGIVLLSILLDEEAVGIYSSAFAIVSMLLIISYAFMYSIYPVMSRLSQHSSENLRFVYEKACLYMLLLGMMIAGIFSIIAGHLYQLLYPPAFSVGASVLAVLVWSLIFTFVHAPISRLMLVYNKQSYLAWMSLLGAILNILLNLWLIPRLGVIGAAWARLGSYGVFFLFNFWYVNTKILRIEVMRSILLPTFILVSMGAVMTFLLPVLGLWTIVAGVFVFIGLVLLLRVGNYADVRTLQKIFVTSKPLRDADA